MNVLHINDYRNGGGCEVLVAATIDLLRGRGVETELFTIDDVPGVRPTPWGYIDHWAARSALRKVMDDFQPEVVHLHNFYHVLSPGILREIANWRTQRRCRVVMTAHDYHLVCPNSGGMWFRGRRGGSTNQQPRRPLMHPIDPRRVQSPAWVLTRRWDHRSFAHAALKTLQHVYNYWLIDARRTIDKVICPSRFIQRLVRNIGLPTVWLPHPAPAAVSDRSRRYGPLRLVFAGRLEPEKGLAEFLQLLPDQYEGMITIIGDGSELNRCQDVAAHRVLSDRVEFLGRLSHAQTLSIIARCHVLVLPSLCLENHPLTLIEALASGTNILVSNHGGMREVVEEFEVGFHFTPGNSDSLASAIAKLWRAHADGTLNSFDVRLPMQQRTEDTFIDSLMRVYSQSDSRRRGNDA